MTCANACMFCFVDQLPEGLRESVYVKDDDYRLSCLGGSFITLSNLDDADIERIDWHPDGRFVERQDVVAARLGFGQLPFFEPDDIAQPKTGPAPA